MLTPLFWSIHANKITTSQRKKLVICYGGGINFTFCFSRIHCTPKIKWAKTLFENMPPLPPASGILMTTRCWMNTCAVRRTHFPKGKRNLEQTQRNNKLVHRSKKLWSQHVPKLRSIARSLHQRQHNIFFILTSRTWLIFHKQVFFSHWNSLYDANNHLASCHCLFCPLHKMFY